MEGNQTLTLALVWQLMRAYTLSLLSQVREEKHSSHYFIHSLTANLQHCDESEAQIRQTQITSLLWAQNYTRNYLTR